MKKKVILLCLPFILLTSCQSSISKTNILDEVINLTKGITNLGMLVGRRANSKYLELQYNLEEQNEACDIYIDVHNKHKIYIDRKNILRKVETTSQNQYTNTDDIIYTNILSSIYGFFIGSNTILSKDNPLVKNQYDSLSELLTLKGYKEVENPSNYPDFTYENAIYSYREFTYDDKLTLAYSYNKESPYQTLFNFEFSFKGVL